jgi:hypothetical protein
VVDGARPNKTESKNAAENGNGQRRDEEDSKVKGKRRAMTDIIFFVPKINVLWWH